MAKTSIKSFSFEFPVNLSFIHIFQSPTFFACHVYSFMNDVTNIFFSLSGYDVTKSNTSPLTNWLFKDKINMKISFTIISWQFLFQILLKNAILCILNSFSTMQKSNLLFNYFQTICYNFIRTKNRTNILTTLPWLQKSVRWNSVGKLGVWSMPQKRKVM